MTNTTALSHVSDRQISDKMELIILDVTYSNANQPARKTRHPNQALDEATKIHHLIQALDEATKNVPVKPTASTLHGDVVVTSLVVLE